MESIIRMVGNWHTTLIGLIAGVVYYVSTTGAKLPATKQDWWNFAFGAAAFAIGFVSKDAKIGSAPRLLIPLFLFTFF